ncbi:MAG TPA: glycosyl hydrolase family 18 protein, partial [Spirochaetota bacterium]
EIWAYLVEGSETAYTGKEPITDLCYFRSIINYKGELIGAKMIPSSVPIPQNVRRHLVIAELSNPALSHFILIKGSCEREKLIEDIVKSSAGYDGIQIDFESVQCDDRNAFFEFLKDLKTRADGKILSVAVPARTREIADAFDYTQLRDIADRLIIMAYDEHWGGSNPGPVASIEWCENVARYTRSEIPREKLIMGVPLYGRSWQNNNYSREVNYSDVEKIRSAGKSRYAKNPKIEYEKKIKVTVFYESVTSIMNKVRLYNGNDIRSIAFWRMGQGPDKMWPVLKKYYESFQKEDRK